MLSLTYLNPLLALALIAGSYYLAKWKLSDSWPAADKKTYFFVGIFFWCFLFSTYVYFATIVPVYFEGRLWRNTIFVCLNLVFIPSFLYMTQTNPGVIKRTQRNDINVVIKDELAESATSAQRSGGAAPAPYNTKPGSSFCLTCRVKVSSLRQHSFFFLVFSHLLWPRLLI